jgi:hypothetical protein
MAKKIYYTDLLETYLALSQVRRVSCFEIKWTELTNVEITQTRTLAEARAKAKKTQKNLSRKIERLVKQVQSYAAEKKMTELNVWSMLADDAAL